MTKKEFLKQNRVEIDRIIHCSCPDIKLNDKDRWAWIMNDEGLYNWAKVEKVRV